MHTQHLSSFAHVATAPGSGGSGICSSDGDTTGSILSETHARPSMLAQGARFDDEEDTIARQQQHVVEMKEREGLEGVGELRWGRGSVDCKAASLCPPPHYTALAHGRWQDVPAAAPYESGALSGIEGDGSDDLVRLSAAWRQVECQRDAQKVHDKAQERVLAALLAVGASSPTLRQARCVMAAEGR